MKQMLSKTHYCNKNGRDVMTRKKT